MLATSFLLASLNLIGLIFIFLKMPPWLQKLILRFAMTFDILFCIGSFVLYGLFGGGTTTLLAAAILDIQVSVALIVGHKIYFEPEVGKKSHEGLEKHIPRGALPRG